MKWIELPLKTVWKTDSGPQEKEQLCSLCFDPPIEVSPHPMIVGMSMLTTGYGTKMVGLSYNELMRRLTGYIPNTLMDRVMAKGPGTDVEG